MMFPKDRGTEWVQRFEKACQEVRERDEEESANPYERGEMQWGGGDTYRYERYRRLPTTMALADRVPAKGMKPGELLFFMAD